MIMSSSDSEEFASADEGENLEELEPLRPGESGNSFISKKSSKDEIDHKEKSTGEVLESVNLALGSMIPNKTLGKKEEHNNLGGKESLGNCQVEPEMKVGVDLMAVSTLSELKINDAQLPLAKEEKDYQTLDPNLIPLLTCNKESKCNDGWSDDESIDDLLEVPPDSDDSKVCESLSTCNQEIIEDNKITSGKSSFDTGGEKSTLQNSQLYEEVKSSKVVENMEFKVLDSDTKEGYVDKIPIKSSHANITDCGSEDSCPIQSNQESQSSWGWNSWGSSILSAATGSMSVLKSHVTQGIDTVLDTVESNLGVPSPEELAKQDIEVIKVDPQKSEEVTANQKRNLLSSIVSVIETTGTKVLTGGLDTLEMIGKTTMNVLQENDPGLRKKRAIFTSNNVSLSEALREAKEEAVKSEVPSSEQIANFSTYFDKHEGLVHLEALEMLSKNYELTVAQELAKLTEPELGNVLKVHESIEEACELDENDPDEEYDHDFKNLLQKNMKVNPTFCLDHLLKAQSEARSRIQNCQSEQEKGTVLDGRELHTSAMDDMSKICAIAMHFFHKTSEYLLVNGIDIESSIANARSVGNTLSCEISILAAKYSSCLNTAADDSENPDEITPMITNVYLEGTNCGMYIQNALKLLVPILKAKSFLTS